MGMKKNDNHSIQPCDFMKILGLKGQVKESTLKTIKSAAARSVAG